MRAIPRTGFGGPEKLVIREIPEPEPNDGHAAVKALKRYNRRDVDPHQQTARPRQNRGQP